MSEELAKKFWRDIASLQSDAVSGLTPVRVKIVSETDGEVTLIRADDPDQLPDPDTHPRLKGFRLQAGQDAFGLPLGNDQLLIIGTLQNSTNQLDLGMDKEYIDRTLVVSQHVNASGNVTAGNQVVGDTVSAASFLLGPGENWLSGQTFLNNADSPVITNGSQASADTPSTTSTTTMQDAISVNITLGDGTAGAGTWAIWVLGSVSLINSASATARVCATIDGVQGNIHVTPALNTAIYTSCAAASVASGLTGNRTVAVKIQYRSGTANTTTAANPSLIVIAKRTG